MQSALWAKRPRFIDWRAACRPRLTVAQGLRVERRLIVARSFQRSLIKSQKLPSVIPIGSVMIAPM